MYCFYSVKHIIVHWQNVFLVVTKSFKLKMLQLNKTFQSFNLKNTKIQTIFTELQKNYCFYWQFEIVVVAETIIVKSEH